MPDIVFPRIPDADAIRAIERRGGNFVPTGHWTDLWQLDHQTAFTVARSVGFDILKDIHSAIIKAMQDGIPFEEFRGDLARVLQARGWWGKTEDGRWLGTPWRLKTIFQTNLRVSAAQGEWQRAQDLKASRPYLRYTALLDGRARPLHASWHGVILPVDHPWWKTHFPPNGFNCRCKTLSVGPESLELYGWQVSEQAPDDGYVEWLNPKTGEKALVPKGIDPGWDYNPGDTDQAARAAKLAMDKLAAMPPKMGAAAITALALSFPQVARELAAWISGITEKIARGVFRPEKDRRIVGALDDQIIRFFEENKKELSSSAISIGDDSIGHALRDVKPKKLPVEMWNIMPELLQNPKHVFWNLHDDALVYVVEHNGLTAKVVIQVNHTDKFILKTDDGRKKIRLATNNIRTGAIITSLYEFENKGWYLMVK